MDILSAILGPIFLLGFIIFALENMVGTKGQGLKLYINFVSAIFAAILIPLGKLLLVLGFYSANLISGKVKMHMGQWLNEMKSPASVNSSATGPSVWMGTFVQPIVEQPKTNVFGFGANAGQPLNSTSPAAATAPSPTPAPKPVYTPEIKPVQATPPTQPKAPNAAQPTPLLPSVAKPNDLRPSSSGKSKSTSRNTIIFDNDEDQWKILL